MANPHFASSDTLTGFLSGAQITQLFALLSPDQQEQQFSYADSVITQVTEVSPADTGDDPILISIASRVVIWMLSGLQQWNDQNKTELDRRQAMYNDAMAQLDYYQPPMTEDEERKDVHKNCRSDLELDTPYPDHEPEYWMGRRMSDW